MPRSDHSFDAIVVGGGVAAFSAAIRLAAGGARVVVATKGGGDQMRIETLSPQAVRWLERHGVEVGGVALEQVVAWWGGPVAHQMRVAGARVIERCRLSASLEARAAELGVVTARSIGVPIPTRAGDVWRLELAHGTATAQFAVDATGRRALLGRQMGSRRMSSHELFCVYWNVVTAGAVGTWTETTPVGWWNLTSLGTQGGLGFFSSGHTVRAQRGAGPGLLSEAPNLGPMVCQVVGQPKTWACGSSLLRPAAGDGWIALGDAALTVQPLASAGVLRAFMDADELSAELMNPGAAVDRREKEYASYGGALTDQYALETRWQDAAFWRERSASIVMPMNGVRHPAVADRSAKGVAP